MINHMMIRLIKLTDEERVRSHGLIGTSTHKNFNESCLLLTEWSLYQVKLTFAIILYEEGARNSSNARDLAHQWVKDRPAYMRRRMAPSDPAA